MKLQRRSVLKALGVFATVPLGRLLESSIAQAQPASAPLKFIGVYYPHGLSMPSYGMLPTETETSFSLTWANCSLAPFDSPAQYGGRSFKNRLVVLEGVDNAVAELSSTPGHGAACTLLTGSTTVGSDHNAQCESLDYYLGRTKGLGADTSFPTLNLGVGALGDYNNDALAHGLGGASIRNQIDPVAVFDMVFGGLTGAVDAGVDNARIKGQSVIDFLKSDLSSLSARLGPTEKLKLAQHLDAIREVEKRVTAAIPTGACQVPSRPQATGNADPSLDFPKLLAWNGGELYYDRITDLQIDLLAEAIACGLTRFATLLISDSNGQGKPFVVDGVSLPLDLHNSAAHTYSEDNAASTQRLGLANQYYFGKVARLLQRLDEGGALASTLVMVSSDMGNPSLHSTRGLPLVLAGGDGTGLVGPTGKKLLTGRRLQAVSDCPKDNRWCGIPELKLTSHNKVLVSIANLFGVDTDTVGYFDPQYVKSGIAAADFITGAYPGLVS